MHHFLIAKPGEQEAGEKNTFPVFAHREKPAQLFLPVFPWKGSNAPRKFEFSGDVGAAQAFEELGDDDDVVKDRVGRHVVLFHERHDEVVQILGRDGVDRGFRGEVLDKALEHRSILAERIRLL